MSWLLAKFQWKLSPRAMLSSPTGHRPSHHAPSVALTTCAGPQLEGCCQLWLRHRAEPGPFPEPGPYGGTQLSCRPQRRGQQRSQKGMLVEINFPRRITDSKSCLMAWNLFVLQSTSCHTWEHRELGTRRRTAVKFIQMWKTPQRQENAITQGPCDLLQL